MEFQINTNNVILIQHDQVESGEYNVTECNFTFASEYDGLTKKAVFTGEDGTAYLQTIVDNKCSIPGEILEVSQVVEIGVYGYDVENEELVLRYSPEPTQFFVHQGSYKEAQNSTPPTPTEIEQLQSQITTNANDIEELQDNIVGINQELVGINGELLGINRDIEDIKAEQTEQNTNIQNNTDDITDINNSIGTINSNINDIQGDISDIKAEQITQNGDIQTNKNDISDIKEEQLTQNQNIQTNAQNISNEILNRQSADNNLQSQIDAITVSSDVIDVLGTYQDLLNYDTSHVKANDIIKVLQDSTHNDSMSYYRWVIVDHVGSWQYVGSEGPYYTRSETDSLLSAKANSNDVYSKTETDTLLNNKADKSEIPDLTDYVKNTDYATANKGGVIKIFTTNNFNADSGGLPLASINSYETYLTKTNYAFIGKGTLENVITGKQLINQTQLEESQATQDTEIETLQNQVEELEQDVEDLRGACYKVEGAGTDITLNNTAQGRLLKNELSGRTEQESLSGKNLAWTGWGENFVDRINNSNIASILNFDNRHCLLYSAQAGYGDYANKYLFKTEWKENTQYTFQLDVRKQTATNTTIAIEYTDGTNATFPAVSAINNWEHITYTSASNKTIKYIRPNYTDGGTFIDLNTFMVEEGSTATSYEPYCGGIPAPNPGFPIPIKNVTGNANVKIQNRNLVASDINNWTRGTYCLLPLKLEQGKTYTLWAERIGELKTNYYNFGIVKKGSTYATFKGLNTVVDYVTGGVSTYNFTVDNSWEEPKLVLFCGNSQTVFNELFQNYNVQFEEGSKTSYVPHQEQNLPFTFSKGQRGMQGTTLEDDGINNNRNQVVFDGTENWQVFDLSSTKKQFYLNISTVKHNETTPTVKSNYFIADVIGNRYSNNNVVFSTSNGVAFVTTTMLTLADWKTWAAQKYSNNQPLIAEYNLKEPEIIPYTQTQQTQYNAIKQARSYDDITYISSTSDELGFNLNVESLGNINTVINNLLNN